MRYHINYSKFMQWKFYTIVKKEAAPIHTTEYYRAAK